MSRSNVLGRKTVTSAYDHLRSVFRSVQYGANVQIKRFAGTSRFFRAVEYRNALCACWQHGKEMFCRERAVQSHRDKSRLFALSVEVIHRLAYGLCNGPHGHYYVFGIRSPVVIERMIFTSRYFRYFSHVVSNHIGQSIVIAVCRFARLEVNVLVHRRTTGNRIVRVESPCAELGQRFFVYKGFERLGVYFLDFLYLVRSTETVEEMNERNASFNSRQMGYAGQVHNFLHTGRSQHGETCLARSHNVLMVAEYRKSLSCKRARRYVEYAWKQFARYFIHIRYHQQESLRCGVRTG